MMTTKKLIEEAFPLPVEERALIADSLLRSLNVPDSAIDARWTEVASRRLQEFRSGKVKPIPGEEVFSDVLKRLGALKAFGTFNFDPNFNCKEERKRR